MRRVLIWSKTSAAVWPQFEAAREKEAGRGAQPLDARPAPGPASEPLRLLPGGDDR